MRPEHWPVGLKEQIEQDWHEQHGDRKTELVCIGQDLDHAAVQAELEACLLTEAEMAGGPAGWFALRDPFYEAWDAEQKMAQGHDHDQFAESVTHVLILHKNESVPLQMVVGVMDRAGIPPNVALRLLTVVNANGQGIVMQGKEGDVKLMVGLFDEIGMKTTVQPGSAPR